MSWLHRTSPEITKEYLLKQNQKLLESIVGGDWSTYESLLDKDAACFEAETNGHVITGHAFHKFFFDLDAKPENDEPKKVATKVYMSQPHVRILSGGKAAVLKYVRINQSVDANGAPITTTVCETRVWEEVNDGVWKNVDVHRS